ncbi:hypothetical protein LTR36_000281 [Oleoguttula mirabilis]|uniref:Uncharacterized protein n=1 Tax=Oleoguttula mirabilis TaxID=1507867 RepID=A0AAV9K055_9PEZI|nr:hypothetical protein LTR36_000281 [Oleoguttula mirabilis]
MYRQQQDASAGAGQQHGFLSASTPSSSFSTTQFPSPLFALDPSLHNSPQHLHPHGLARQPSPDRRISSEMPGSMQPPSSASPRMNRSTPVRASPGPFKPTDRALPGYGVAAGTISDAYVVFILYCNPHFPLDVDTATLRTNFNSPPKSDSKNFETYRLFELIQKFDAKEIKTWGELALELGVEAPDVSKGQSVQKVQQYSVRLKRWMRAMHVDAFFEYLLAKQHSYFTDIPHPSDPYPAGGRDGVVAEEDLAIRALDPAFRPKRGRRRNSETEQDDDADLAPAGKQRRLDETNHFGQSLSAYPASAHPDAYHDPWAMASAVTPQGFAPWANRAMVPQSAMTSTAPSSLRWQLHGGSQNVATPHPMTAHPTSMAAHIETAFDEPKSAVTSARRRRKHGPAVSSAWPSANAPGAKPRGRPPASRNVQDGPFSTFPADPANEKGVASVKSITPDPAVGTEVMATPQMPAPLRRQSDGPGRPGRLSLQVPRHTGGPVRLATPPPRVLVNGETNDSDAASVSITPTIETAPQLPRMVQQRVRSNTQASDREIPGFAFEVLKRVLVTDLIMATLVGRQQRLNSDEAKRLADAVLQRLRVPRQDTEEPSDDIARLTAASWLGLGEQLNVPLGPATSQGKCITVTRFRMDAEGYEEIVSAHIDGAGDVREVFDLSWTVSMAGCNGKFELKGLTLGEPPPHQADSHDLITQKYLTGMGPTGLDEAGALSRAMRDVGGTRGGGLDDGIDWRARCMAMEFGGRMAYGEMKRLKNRVIEQVLDVLL